MFSRNLQDVSSGFVVVVIVVKIDVDVVVVVVVVDVVIVDVVEVDAVDDEVVMSSSQLATEGKAGPDIERQDL